MRPLRSHLRLHLHPRSLLDVAAVPEATPATTQQLRQLQQASPGGYGYGRALLQSSPGGYGYGSGRRLAEEAAAPLEPRDPVLEYAEQRDAAHDAALMREQAAAGGVSAAAVAALKHAAQAKRARRSSGGVVLPAGSCYCRYDQDFNTWALAEEACKDALYARCQVRKGTHRDCLMRQQAYMHDGEARPDEGACSDAHD